MSFNIDFRPIVPDRAVGCQEKKITMKMIRKFMSFAAMAALMISAGSCQKEIIAGIDDGGAKVSFTFNMGDQHTKAIADASNIDIMYWEIYGEDVLTAQKPLAGGFERDTDGDGVFTLDLSLIQDQTYNFIFWAQVEPASGKEHYDVSDLRKVGIMTYDDEKANDESRAAFFAYETFHISGAIKETITLYRPFAQLNMGTEHYNVPSLNLSGDLKVNTSEVTVYGIADAFNTITGKGEGKQNVHFEKNMTPNGDADAIEKKLEVNASNYHWLGMNYLIVNGDSDNVKVDMIFHTTHGDVDLSVNNVPIKENYRTNIIGDLLTTDAIFKIVIDEEFQTPDYIVGDEGGSEEGGETPIPDFVITQDGDNLTYTVYTPEGLEAWREAAHQDALNDTEKQINLILGADIPLEYIEGEANWTPVGTYDHPYDGTIDGAGHYISDMSVDSEGEPAGFIGAWDGEDGGIAAQNLTFRNVHILSSNEYGTGTIVGYGHKKYVIKNCHVKGGSVSGIGGGPCGGLFGGGFEAGFDDGAGGSGQGFGGTAIGCTNSASVITYTITYYVGGIGGFGNAIDCTNTGTVTGSGYYIGGILGGSNGQVTGNKNHGKVTGGTYAGGIVGGIEDGTLENNSNYGDVFGTEDGKLGGIFGWLDGSTVQSGNTYQCIVKVIVVDQDYTVKVEPEVTTYTVYTAEGLEMWRAAAHQNAVEKKSDKVNLLLAADIELPVVEEGSSNWTPLGTTSAPYNGIIDGAGFTISNLTISGGSNVGFIGAASNGGNVVSNLNLANVNVSGHENVGAVIGQVTNDGKVDNCHVFSGKVTGTGNNVGGILGYSKNYGGVNKSSNGAEVSGASYVGGIAGYAYGSYCVNTGKVTGTGNYVGGIFAYKTWSVSGTSNNENFGDVVGKNYVGGIAGACGQSNSYNEGTIIGEKYVGGISGSMSILEGTSTQCINKGEVIGVENVGGICGTTGGRSHITLAVNEGKVTGEQYVGGIAGSFGGALSGKARNLTACRNTAEVIGKAYVGGILGYNSGSNKNPITGNVNEANVSGEDKVAGIVGYNSNATVTGNTNSGNISGYTHLGQIIGEQNASYSPDTVTGNSSDGSVTILENSDFTRTVDGTTVSYIVYTQRGFEAWVAEAHKSVEEGFACNLTLETDIVLPVVAAGESNWTPIGNYERRWASTQYVYPNHYSGNIDGQGHTISNLTVNTTVSGAGFIGQINGGYIKNLNFANVNIKSTSSNVAVCAGVVSSTKVRIENCHVESGSVQGSGSYVAGIASGTSERALVINCSNKANITGNGNYVGGVAGDISCVDCQNFGTVLNNTTSKGYTGGITGRGDVTGSTNYGNVTSYKTVAGITGSGDATGCRNSGNITGTDIEVCGISGIGYVTDSHNTGTIISTGKYAAGIVGQGGASGCTNSGDVTGKTYVGGISGSVTTDVVTNCHNSGTVTATGDYAGGIAGRHTNNSSASKATEFAGCENIGVVTSSGNYVGGIVGESNSGYCVIKESINRGAVSGKDYVGGIAGSSRTVTDCDNYGDVEGNQNVGGISGAKYDAAHSISGSENRGTVTGVSYVGGIVGVLSDGTVSNNTNEGTVKYKSTSGLIVGYQSGGTITDDNIAGGKLEQIQ